MIIMDDYIFRHDFHCHLKTSKNHDDDDVSFLPVSAKQTHFISSGE